jgi:hypothetical protein
MVAEFKGARPMGNAERPALIRAARTEELARLRHIHGAARDPNATLN